MTPGGRIFYKTPGLDFLETWYQGLKNWQGCLILKEIKEMYSKTTCKDLDFILVLKVIEKDFLDTIGVIRVFYGIVSFYRYDSERIFRI